MIPTSPEKLIDRLQALLSGAELTAQLAARAADSPAVTLESPKLVMNSYRPAESLQWPWIAISASSRTPVSPELECDDGLQAFIIQIECDLMHCDPETLTRQMWRYAQAIEATISAAAHQVEIGGSFAPNWAVERIDYGTERQGASTYLRAFKLELLALA